MCSFSEKSEAKDKIATSPKKNGSKSVIDYSIPQTNRENLLVTSKKLSVFEKSQGCFLKYGYPKTMGFNTKAV